MKNYYLFTLLLLSSFVSFISHSEPVSKVKNTMVLIEKAYVRATIPGTSISSSYMEIVNDSAETVTLLGVSSQISPRIEIHQHSMFEGMMRMRKLESIDIPPKGRVILQPSGLHLMIFDVKKPLKAEQQIKLNFNFSNKMSLTTQVPVFSPTQEKAARTAAPDMHGHHH